MQDIWSEIKRGFAKFHRNFERLTGKKHHLEFFTALLSLPVLITVLILNISNLNSNKKTQNSTADEKKQEIVITIPQQQTEKEPAQTNPTAKECQPVVGDVSIASPKEGETVVDNPVGIDIVYNDPSTCAVVWSYRVNGGKWSDFDDKSIALFNLPNGDITVDLRVKSIIKSAEEKLLTRKFIYKGNTTVATPTPSPTSSPAGGSTTPLPT